MSVFVCIYHWSLTHHGLSPSSPPRPSPRTPRVAAGEHTWPAHGPAPAGSEASLVRSAMVRSSQAICPLLQVHLRPLRMSSCTVALMKKGHCGVASSVLPTPSSRVYVENRSAGELVFASALQGGWHHAVHVNKCVFNVNSSKHFLKA